MPFYKLIPLFFCIIFANLVKGQSIVDHELADLYFTHDKWLSYINDTSYNINYSKNSNKYEKIIENFYLYEQMWLAQKPEVIPTSEVIIEWVPEWNLKKLE